jgi:hypothetical protein
VAVRWCPRPCSCGRRYAGAEVTRGGPGVGVGETLRTAPGSPGVPEGVRVHARAPPRHRRPPRGPGASPYPGCPRRGVRPTPGQQPCGACRGVGGSGVVGAGRGGAFGQRCVVVATCAPHPGGPSRRFTGYPHGGLGPCRVSSHPRPPCACGGWAGARRVSGFPRQPFQRPCRAVVVRSSGGGPLAEACRVSPGGCGHPGHGRVLGSACTRQAVVAPKEVGATRGAGAAPWWAGQ